METKEWSSEVYQDAFEIYEKALHDYGAAAFGGLITMFLLTFLFGVVFAGIWCLVMVGYFVNKASREKNESLSKLFGMNR